MDVQNQTIDGLLEKALQDDVPADVERRLRSQMADFQARLCAGTVSLADRRKSPPQVMTWCLGVCAAVILLAVLGNWILQPQKTFAEVAAALEQQPWIHVVDAGSQGGKREIWYSPTKKIFATRDDQSIQFRDHKRSEYYAYDVKNKTLYRVPEYRSMALDQQEKSYSAFVAAMRIIFQDEKLPDRPLEKLEFLGSQQAGWKVIDQKLEKTEAGGHAWLDYHLTLRDPKQPEPCTMEFRVDAATKLLKSARFETKRESKQEFWESQFEYPDDGPRDIYALGVPKIATLVDRTPSDEMKRIFESLENGRRQMDNYRAVLEDDSLQQDVSGWMQLPKIIYRKGTKFCVVNPYWSSKYPPELKKPATNENMAEWWRARLKQFQFYPWAIYTGPTLFNINTKDADDAGGGKHLEVASVHETDMRNSQTTSWSYGEWSPELICRPDVPIPQETMEPVLDKNPQEGPPGTILLHVRRLDKVDTVHTADGRELVQPDAYRYWLDPAHDYVVVRFDMLSGAEQGKEEIISSHIVEDFAKSPSGVWYATRYLSRTQANAKLSAELHGAKYMEWEHRFYVDFDVDIPDAMFVPQQVGERIRLYP